MKKITILMLILALAWTASAQNYITVTGVVIDSATQAGIPGHPVTIMSDSLSGWYYNNTVLTDANGMYTDTSYPTITQGSLTVRTIDCQNAVFEVLVPFNPAQNIYTVNISICNSNNPCQAAYTYSQPQPLKVQFFDESVGGQNVRLWEFGDGSTSSQANPFHQYSQPGFYDVTLTIGALGTTCYDIFSLQIFVWADSTGGGCQASFYSYPDSLNTLDTYHFINTSIGSFTSWLWDFGDGNTSNNYNAVHTYAQPGTYTVCLTVSSGDSLCHDMTCQSLTVGGVSNCFAAFTAFPDSSNASTIHFIDQSTGNITNWLWNFGDGSTSELQHPVHTYPGPGYYLVSLQVSSPNQWCFDIHYDTVYISGGSGCQAYFTYNQNPSTGNNTLYFTDLSAGNPGAWQWTFGDGTASALQSPSHTYNNPGTYTVCLTITGNNCTDTYCQTVVVEDTVTYQQVYGQVFAGGFPVNSGLVMIFSIDSLANYQPYIDIFPIDSVGVYYFTMVPEGLYYILAIPFDSTGFLPTYYGNTIHWQSATVITLGTANNPYNINLVEAEQMITGPGSAAGTISMGDVSTGLLDKINMILKNSQGQPVGFARVSEAGVFEFPSLAYGSYYLQAEMPGVPADQVMITLTAGNPHAEVVMTFAGSTIHAVRDDGQFATGYTLFPNPVTDLLTVSADLKIPVTATVTVFGLTGRQVFRSEVTLQSGRNTIEVPATALPAGLYTLRITAAEGEVLTAKFLRTNR